MKTLLLLIIMAITCTASHAQVIKRLGQRAKDKLERKAGDKVDKGIDDATDGKEKEKKNEKTESDNKKDDKNGEVARSDESSSSSSSSGTSSTASDKPASLETYSKYDFVPGEKVIAYEDFKGTDIGDFPQRWNTNATGEVVTINNNEGKWLKIVKEGVFHPEFISNFPENFTLEFDLGINDQWDSWPLSFNIANLKSPDEFTHYNHYVEWQGDHALHFEFKPSVYNGGDGFSKLTIGKDGNHQVDNQVTYNTWDNSKNKFAHVSIWRQKQRLRVYLNGEKIWDIPRGFDNTATYNALTIATPGAYGNHPDFYIINNIRLAIGAPDTRNKLITEGKFVTHGILFDINKDVVKAESYGTLKDIANVLKENMNVKVKIVGHTDADGDDKNNMELSLKRAQAVKAALNKEFGIDESRMQTDGKGESQPAEKNDTEMGKANNRRVEFIKL
jgi:OOP family OmpA-OmpF porin